MTTVDRSIVSNLLANSPTLDEIAVLIFNAVTSKGISGQSFEAGVQFSAIDGTSNFRASVHKVKLLVSYEQEVHMREGTKVLAGVFRARLDEPVKADRIEISSFLFDSFGNTQSAGDVIKTIYIDPRRNHVTRANIACLLAYDVQRYIQADPPEW